MIMPGLPEGLRESKIQKALLERDADGDIVFGNKAADGEAAQLNAYTSDYERSYGGYDGYGPDAYGPHGDYDYHAPASKGETKKLVKKLLIDNVLLYTGDTPGVGLFLDVKAKSPSAGDHSYGKWEADLERYVNVIEADKKPLVTIQGDAEYPDSVTVWGKLSDVGIPALSFWLKPTFSEYDVEGWVPDTFKIDPAPTKCYYKVKCAKGSNQKRTFEGTVSVSHSGLEKASLYELAGRSWFPKHPVKFVCTINKNQTYKCPA
jgi:hypothetical protein